MEIAIKPRMQNMVHSENMNIVFVSEILFEISLNFVFSRPPGAKFDETRIQGRMQIFGKMSQKALNRVLTVPQHSTRRELSRTTLKMF